MTRTQYFIAINRAQLDGFYGLADAILALYRRDYPAPSLADALWQMGVDAARAHKA